MYVAVAFPFFFSVFYIVQYFCEFQQSVLKTTLPKKQTGPLLPMLHLSPSFH